MLKRTSLQSVTSKLQLAQLVTATFLEQAQDAKDGNQCVFNAVVAHTLNTHDFKACFERLLVRTDFQAHVAFKVFKQECVFDVYSVDNRGVGEYEDQRLADNVAAEVFPKSNLLTSLMHQAYDFVQESELDD